MSQSTVTAKGQTTIPQDVRQHLNLKPGDRVTFVKEANGTARLIPKNVKIQALAGLLKSDRHATIEEMNDAIADAASEHVMKSLGEKPPK